ncbi:MAG: histidinol-phosphate transaminase [Opitutales bacterium]|nr:histidinol-phosphate transaminase [Opitutales bacterium]
MSSGQSPADLALAHLREHITYVPGKQPDDWDDFVKLNTNENPYPPSPLVEEAVRAEISNLRLYPNPPSQLLREKIADLHGLSPSQVIVGNGSDELLTLCVRCFANAEKPIGITTPSYSLYRNLASLQGAPVIDVPFEADFSLDPQRIGFCKANLFFLTTPNAPSGVGYSNGALVKTLNLFPGILVADEAYADFAPKNAVSLLADYPRLLIVRTLSKSYGLAGLRVGYALGSPDVIALLDKAREIYNVDRLAQAAALAAIRDQDHFRSTKEKILATRDNFTKWLRDKKWNTYDSQTNFVFTEPRTSTGRTGSEVAQEAFDFLVERKVLTRRFAKHPLTSSRLRISIGTEIEMGIVAKAIEEWLRKELGK